MDRVDAVRVTEPGVKGEEGPRVAAVGGPGPAEALGQEFGVGA